MAFTVNLRDTGDGALSDTSLVITGASTSKFVQSDTWGGLLPAGTACTIRVTFRSSAGGNRTALASIFDKASGSPLAVSLSGMGSPDVILPWVVTPSSENV